MRYQSAIGAISFLAMMGVMVADGQAWDDAKYPNLKGQWIRIGSPRWERPDRQAPLTAEYRANYEANLKDQAAGGQGTTPTYTCLSPGMPRVTSGYGEVEFVVTPDTTHILVQHIHDNRRIFTDGRDWPADLSPTFLGYSIGKWIDSDGAGRYDVLEVETRGFRGPRAFDASGLPLHADNKTVVKERIYLDKADPNVLRDEVTVIDNALTRPWTVTKNFRREKNSRPYWQEINCAENNNHVLIGKENYMLSADGYLMPARKNQSPPDLRFFDQARK